MKSHDLPNPSPAEAGEGAVTIAPCAHCGEIGETDERDLCGRCASRPLCSWCDQASTCILFDEDREDPACDPHATEYEPTYDGRRTP